MSILTPELKPFEAPFLSTNDSRFLSHKFLKKFEDWLTTIEVRPGVYEKPEIQKCLCHRKSIKGIKSSVGTVIELAYKVFNYA